MTSTNGAAESAHNQPGAEQDSGGTGIDAVIRAAKTGKGCVLDAERTAQIEETYRVILSLIRDQEQAIRGREAQIDAMKARAAALTSAARTLVVALGSLPDDQRAKVKDEVHALLAEVDGIAPDAREFIVVRRETLTEMERATREAIAAGEPAAFDQWAVFAQMGHVTYPGRVRVVKIAGQEQYRIDVPKGDGFVTVYAGSGSMYSIKPATEAVIRHLAKRWGAPEPAQPWDLPKVPEIEAAATEPSADAWYASPDYDRDEDDHDDGDESDGD